MSATAIYIYLYGNIYHQYTPNVSIYTIHGSYGYGNPQTVVFSKYLVNKPCKFTNLFFPGGVSYSRKLVSGMFRAIHLVALATWITPTGKCLCVSPTILGRD